MRITELRTLEVYTPEGDFVFGLGMLSVSYFEKPEAHISTAPNSVLRKIVEQIVAKTLVLPNENSKFEPLQPEVNP